MKLRVAFIIHILLLNGIGWDSEAIAKRSRERLAKARPPHMNIHNLHTKTYL